jgi:hypothetical protein
VRGLGNASNRGKWHFLDCTLNLELNIEIGRSASPSCVIDLLPAHGELPDPTAHLRIREGIITGWFEQLEVEFPALQALPPADFNEETLLHMIVTYR